MSHQVLKKLFTHSWSSSSIKHLGQIQEIRHKSSQVQRPQMWVFGQGKRQQICIYLSDKFTRILIFYTFTFLLMCINFSAFFSCSQSRLFIYFPNTFFKSIKNIYILQKYKAYIYIYIYIYLFIRPKIYLLQDVSKYIFYQ